MKENREFELRLLSSERNEGKLLMNSFEGILIDCRAALYCFLGEPINITKVMDCFSVHYKKGLLGWSIKSKDDTKGMEWRSIRELQEAVPSAQVSIIGDSIPKMPTAISKREEISGSAIRYINATVQIVISGMESTKIYQTLKAKYRANNDELNQIITRIGAYNTSEGTITVTNSTVYWGNPTHRGKACSYEDLGREELKTFADMIAFSDCLLDCISVCNNGSKPFNTEVLVCGFHSVDIKYAWVMIEYNQRTGIPTNHVKSNEQLKGW